MFSHSWIQLFLTSIDLSMLGTLQMTEADIFSAVFDIDNNGTVTDSRKSPICDKGQSIKLLSYDFRYKHCSRPDRCSDRLISFPPDAVMTLHDSCSIKEECNSLTFPTPTDQERDKPGGVEITYQCLGKRGRFYEMCRNSDELVAGTFQLTAGNSTELYTSCKCSLQGENDSLLSITLRDIRLYSIDNRERHCSDSVFKVDDTIVVCNETLSAFGSVFSEELLKDVYNKTVNLSLDIEEPTFEMVWLTVETYGSIMMKCKVKPRKILSSDITSFTGYIHPSSSNISVQSDGRSKDITPPKMTFLYIVLGMVITIVVACTVFILYKNRPSRTKSESDQCARLGLICSSSLFSGDSLKLQSMKKNNKQNRAYFTEENSAYVPEQKHPLENNPEITEKGKRMRHREICCLRILLRSNLPHSKQIPEQELEDTHPSGDDFKSSAKLDNQPNTNVCDTPLIHTSQGQGETLKTDRYRKESGRISIEETGQTERAENARKPHVYASLKLVRNYNGAACTENEIYNTTKCPQPELRDPTYNHLPVERASTQANYARTCFLTPHF